MFTRHLVDAQPESAGGGGGTQSTRAPRDAAPETGHHPDRHPVDLRLADLTGYGLRRLGATRAEIIDSDPRSYPHTACWACPGNTTPRSP